MSWRDLWEALRESPEDRAFVLAAEAKQALAANVYSLRKQRGLSQAALAELVGTKQPNISDIETADANVTIGTLGKVAAALGVSVADLLRDTPTAEQSGSEAGTETASAPKRLGQAV